MMVNKTILCTPTELKLLQQVIHQISRKRSHGINADILKILLDHPEFTRLHLSLYYPFTIDDLEKYRDKLIWGSVRYTTFVWDIRQEPIQFAEIGLSFNVNLFTLCTDHEFIIARQIGIKQNINSAITRKLPLHLAGELEDRYATTIMAPHLQRPFLENFDPEQKAEDILVAYELCRSFNIVNRGESLKILIEQFGLLCAYSKALWDDFLEYYLNEEMLEALLEHL